MQQWHDDLRERSADHRQVEETGFAVAFVVAIADGLGKKQVFEAVFEDHFADIKRETVPEIAVVYHLIRVGSHDGFSGVGRRGKDFL